MTAISVQPITDLKAQARRLRAALADQGTIIGHSESLELLAQQMGFRNWNTLRAASPDAGSNHTRLRLRVGDQVRGAYLGQPFTGRLLALREVDGGAWFEVTLQFDVPVDVVEFESFSALRSRVRATVNAEGVSPQHRSDGTPHLKLAL